MFHKGLDEVKIMKYILQLCTVFAFISNLSLAAKNLDSFQTKPPENLYKSESSNEKFLYRLVSDIDVDSDDEDNESLSINTAIKSKVPYRTNKTIKPDSVDKNYYANVEEIDPKRYEELRNFGLRTIEENEAKGTKTAVKIIIDQLLHNTIPAVRAEAARSLGRLRRGLFALHTAINTDGYEVRYAAYESIDKIGSKNSAVYFVKGVKSSDPLIRVISYRGLGKIRSAAGRDLILKTGIHSEDPKIVGAALDGLGYYGKTEDLYTLSRYVKSKNVDVKAGAVRGLGNHKHPKSLDILIDSLKDNREVEADIILAVSKKNSLSSTLTLLKIMSSTQNENYKEMIQRELRYRKAYGKYAIISFPVATLRKYPQAGSQSVYKLSYGDVARIKKVTSKHFKAKMNNKVIEDRYYLLQAYTPVSTTTNAIKEGWIFGPKIKIISITHPVKYAPSKKVYDKYSEDEETEEDIELKKKIEIKTEIKTNTNVKNHDDEEDETTKKKVNPKKEVVPTKNKDIDEDEDD